MIDITYNFKNELEKLIILLNLQNPLIMHKHTKQWKNYAQAFDTNGKKKLLQFKKKYLNNSYDIKLRVHLE